eukprot:5317710-Amphidinium_carterae.2
MIESDAPELPELKAIQPERRIYRFEMAKGRMMSADRIREIGERCKREREEERAIREQLEKDKIKMRATAEAVSQLPPIDPNTIVTFPQVPDSVAEHYASRVIVPNADITPPGEEDEDEENRVHDEAMTTADGMSPKNMLDVDENAIDSHTTPYLGDALRTLGECERMSGGLTANKIRPSSSASAAAAAASKPAVRTLRLPAKTFTRW